MKPDIRTDTGCKNRPDNRYNLVFQFNLSCLKMNQATPGLVVSGKKRFRGTCIKTPPGRWGGGIQGPS